MREKKEKKIYKKQVFGVGVKKSRGIKILFDVEEEDLDLYRSLLIDSLDIPVKPILMFYIFHFTKIFPWPLRGYREASVCILGKHSSGIEGWHSFTMPVTGRLALWTGRQVGYPKYRPKSLTLRSNGNSWEGIIMHDHNSPLKLEFTPANIDIPWENMYNNDKPFLLPSKEPGKINILESVLHDQTKLQINPGIVTVTIDSKDPWSELLHGNQREGPGVFHQFEGKRYLTRRDQRPL